MFQFFSVMHFCFFRFNSFHSVNLFPQNASFFSGSSRVFCLVMLFFFYPLIFTVALVLFCLSPPHFLLWHYMLYCDSLLMLYHSFTIWSLSIYDKTQNTEQDPCLICNKQGKKHLLAGKTQNKQLKRSLLSHISSFEHTKQELYTNNLSRI